MVQHYKLQMKQEKEKHAAHVKQLQNEVENLKELLHAYEISISRKDEVVTQLHILTVPLCLKDINTKFLILLFEQHLFLKQVTEK